MSANIPFEIQMEIIKRVLPVKSLLRFRSVSKQWKSLIDSSEFIMDHSVNRTYQHHLLVRYEVDSESKSKIGRDYKYVLIVDDDSFPRNKSSPVAPSTVNLVSCFAHLLDSSHGLVFLYGHDVCGKSMVVVWNPSIRKYICIKFSPLPHGSAIGFGVCPKTSDPKIVKIMRLHVGWKVEVLTLRFGAWRSISMNIHLPRSTQFKTQHVVIDGVIYWVAHDSTRGHRECERIITFNLTDEEFGEVDLPNSLVRRDLSISKLNESLVVFDYDGSKKVSVWKVMKNGFAKLFSLSSTNDGFYLPKIMGFRKNGEVIREEPCGHYATLVTHEAYEPSTKHTSDIQICVSCDSNFMITWYTESLLLLNNTNSLIEG